MDAKYAAPNLLEICIKLFFVYLGPGGGTLTLDAERA